MAPNTTTAATVAHVIREEAKALTDLAGRLDPTAYERAATILTSCPGGIHVTGAGTSGAIAAKIAATLASFGLRAGFLHPADAMHGGLGRIGNDDCVIAISNSGETAELLDLLPSLQRRNTPLVAILGTIDSSLGRQAQVVLDAEIGDEACRLNLAPTSSSTIALAVGDALSIVVQERIGLTREQFAGNHPSGRLGRRLTLTVDNLMVPSAEATPLAQSASLIDAVRSISASGCGATVVTDPDGDIAGLITDGDIRRALDEIPLERLGTTAATTIMTATPVVVALGTLANDALQLMEDRPSAISVLPVADGSRYVGILRLHDIVKAGL